MFGVMLRPCCLVLLGSAILSLAAGGQTPQPGKKPDDEKQQRKRLTGVWTGYVVEGNGEKADRGPVKMTLTITETTIRGVEIKQDGSGKTVDHGTGDFAIDLAATPHRLDATQTRPNGQKARHLGIYSLEGDTLKWCVTKRRTRPEAFTTAKGSFLLILKRAPAK